jgi:hypothetical protein
MAWGTMMSIYIHKCVIAMRFLAYGVAAYTQDDYLDMAEYTCIEAMHMFCAAVVKVFGPTYLSAQNVANTSRLMDHGAKRGSPWIIGCIGSGIVVH